MPPATSSPKPPTAANRLGLDYRREAARLTKPPIPIIDAHLHVNGSRAARIFAEAADLFGVSRFYSQTRLSDVEAARAALGDRIRFLAVPDWGDPDRGHAYRQGFLDNLQVWHDKHGARMVKFWCAPRLWDLVGAFPGDPRDCVPVDSPWRIRAAELAQSLGMMFACHIADPDTWFATKYKDASKYGGAKRDHYRGLERMLDRFTNPWLLAHMGGYPEDLDFLDGLLERHPNLWIDTSATKWVVRELSRHPRGRVRDFLARWPGRILFGSDIVTMEDHLKSKDPDAPQTAASPIANLADGEEAAFDLYASRYFALRTMWETDFEGESPIADPDLKMVDPANYNDLSAPTLRGLGLDTATLRTLYSGAAAAVLDRWYGGH